MIYGMGYWMFELHFYVFSLVRLKLIFYL